MGGSQGSSTSTTTPSLYNWQSLLPPWVQTGQQTALPWLMQRAEMGGMLPGDEATLSGMARRDIDTGTGQALKGMGSRMAMSGANPASPAATEATGSIMSDRLSNMTNASMNLAKMKMGASSSAINQMLTGLYTPPPYAVGSTSQSQSPSSGGGK